MKKKILLMGPQGSGKGTIGAIISEKLSIPLIGMGDMLRQELKQQTELGKKIQHTLDKGELVSTDLLVDMISNRLAQDDTKDGFLLDGFPRNDEQAQVLKNILVPDLVLVLDLPLKDCIDRIIFRQQCKSCGEIYNTKYSPSRVEGKCDQCGGELFQRADDQIDAIKHRLQIYELETKPLLALYQEMTHTIEVLGKTKEEIVEEALRVIEE